MNLDDIEFDIKIIEGFFFHRVSEINKVDQEYNNIREIIINEKNKLRGIIFNKYAITNDNLYYKNRLWVFESMYTFIIQEIYD